MYSIDVPFGQELPQTFCGTTQGLHEFLILVVEEGDLFNMEEEIWKGVRKDPVIATALTQTLTLDKAPSSRGVPPETPRVEKPTCSISPESPSVAEPEGVALPQDQALVPSQSPPPPGFSSWVPGYLITSPLEATYLPGCTTLFGHSALESLEMTISHNPVMGKVHYPLQAQSLSRITLLSTSTLRHLEHSPRAKET